MDLTHNLHNQAPHMGGMDTAPTRREAAITLRLGEAAVPIPAWVQPEVVEEMVVRHTVGQMPKAHVVPGRDAPSL